MAADALPQVSVVLPTYNGSRYLAEAIQSVIDQTFEDWELIIVDDCSTDETPQIIARFVQQDPRIRYIRQEANRKLPAALNTGFADARGDFFTWTSDDNLYRPEALAVLLGFLRDNADVDVVYADYTIIDESGTVTARWRVCEPEGLAEDDVVGACFLYRRAVDGAIGGYDEDMFCVEDYDFWLRAAAQSRFRALHTDLYLYRLHPGSLTSRNKKLIHDATMLAIERAIGKLGWVGRGQRARVHLKLSQWALKHSQHRRAWGHFLRALASAPGQVAQFNRRDLCRLVCGRRAGDLVLAAYARIRSRKKEA